MSETKKLSGEVAIIGMASRFPGAKNPQEFWRNLEGGVESIRFLSDEELLAAGVTRREFEDPNYVRACPVLDDVKKFDAAFFGMSPREASVMDPTHRFFLEVVWEALENSGNTGLHEEGSVGVFAGAGGPFYLMHNVRTNDKIMAEVGEFLARHTGNDMNFLATRASYELDLRGPSMNIQTACSSALVALHQARESLLRGECDMALAGGSTINVPLDHGYHYSEGEILSPDGHCRPFDHRSAGTVFGSGTGCLVVKRLDDALDDGDTIHAVVKGSAINNDGALKVGYLAPGVERQVDVIVSALESGQIEAESISYVETHGTGTSVGDPIELMALSEALSKTSTKKQFCGVGSVKSNIGHLGEAAATASLIKVIQSFKHKALAPTLGFERPNPRFDLADSPLYVVDKLKPWTSDRPLRAGITALGAGGTNCHVILEEPPAPLPGEGGRDAQLIVLSAKTRTALDQMCLNLADAIEQDPGLDLADAAYTLALGRRALPIRRAVALRQTEATSILRELDSPRMNTTVTGTEEPRLAFSFPGGGAQYAGMAADLYREEELFREVVDECFETIDEVLDLDLRTLLFAAPESKKEATKKLERPSLSLPALFTVEYALARLFESWGLRADAYVGHSMGEYVAACLAGVFSVGDAIRLVVTRGRLFETTAPGGMVALSVSEEQARGIMPDGLSIAAINAPELCVVSGPRELLEEFKKKLAADDEIDFTPIHIDVAAHSSMLESILDEFRSFCRTIEFRAPERRLTSNLSGTWLTTEQATDPEYWVQHLRNSVRFSDCVETVLKDGPHVFLEIGPGRTLTSLARAQKTPVVQAVNSIRHFKEEANDLDFALFTLGKVWAAGVRVDWSALYEDQLRNRIPLPTYPFEGREYWVEASVRKSSENDELIKREDIGDWFYAPGWEPCPSSPSSEVMKRWLIISDHAEGAERLARELRLRGAETVVTAEFGTKLRRRKEQDWVIDPTKLAHFTSLFEVLERDGLLPDRVVLSFGFESSHSSLSWVKSQALRFLQSVDKEEEAENVDREEAGWEADQRAYLGAVHLARALADAQEQSDLCIVTTGAYRVGSEAIRPSRRLATAPALVVPHELPEISARFIDVENPQTDLDWASLADELGTVESSRVIALRRNGRWRRKFSSVTLNEPAPELPLWALERHSVIVLAGGLGGIALAVAEHWAKKEPTLRFAFLTRRQIPPRSEWTQTLAKDATPAIMKAQLASLLAIEEIGCRVMVVSADVCDLPNLERAASVIRENLGPIDVVVQAAGLFDDGPFQTKSDRQILKVLAPKVQGTYNLQEAMGGEAKLFLMFSSIASFLGLPGQIDYAAANAFLDAMAEAGPSTGTSRWVSVGWNAWRDVGMVADKLATGGIPPLPTNACAHPLFAGYEANATGHRVAADLSVEGHWLLQEHRVRGGAHLVPGTGFLELIRAAHRESTGNKRLALSSVNFLAPFQVATGQKRRLEISIVRESDGYEVSLRSFPGMVEHVNAYLRSAQPEAATTSLDLAAIKQRCPQDLKLRDGGFLAQDFVDFGPRWGNILAISSGENEALLELKLPEPFRSDLQDYEFHPAMMDMATGGAQHLISGFQQGEDFFVPLAYEEIRFLAPVSEHCFSHVRINPRSQGEIAVFDISVVDPEGVRLVEIEGFTMKRVNKEAAIVQEIAPAADQGESALEELVREAILPEEGVLALDRVLNQKHLRHVVASSVDVNLWLKQLESDKRSGDEDDGAQTFERPDLGVDYLAPEGSIERGIAELWSKLLGIEAPGANDEFFALGGDSLVAVRFFAKVKKEWGVSLPISTLFQAATIRALGKVLQERGVAVEHEETAAQPAGREFVPFRQLRSGAEEPRKQLSEAGLFRRTLTKIQATPTATDYVGGGRTWLIFLDDAKVGDLLRQSLSESGDTVICVRAGDVYHRASSTMYTVTPERGREEMAKLVTDLKASATLPSDIVHMWLLTENANFRAGSSFFHRTQEQGCFALLSLFQALADAELDAAMRVSLVSNSIYQTKASPQESEGKATALGPLETASYEFPRLQTRHIDVMLDEGTSASARKQLSLALRSALTGHWVNTPLLIRGDQLERVGFSGFQWTNPRPQSPDQTATHLLVGDFPLNSLLEVASTISKQGGSQLGWIRDTRRASEDENQTITEALRGQGIELKQITCDLTNREQLRAAFLPFSSGSQGQFSLIVGLPAPQRELMQLLSDGSAEDLLAVGVLTASLITELSREYFSKAVVLFVVELPPEQAGVAIERAGSAFLERHVLRCRELGQKVSLFVKGPTETLAEGPSHLVDCLECLFAKVELPTTIWAVPAGGASVVALPITLKEQPANSTPESAAIDPELLQLFAAAAGTSEYKAEALLTEYGADRLDAARLATHLKHRYELPQSVGELSSLASPVLFSKFLELHSQSSGVQANSYKYLVPIHSGEPGPKKPFFLVAGMFGNILNLRHLGRLLGAERPVYGVQARGLFGEADPYETIEEMAEAYLEEIVHLLPDGPFALGGFSGGGLTAYEMARRLREAGKTVSSLIMLDTPFPHYPEVGWKDRLMVQKIRFEREGAAYAGDWVKNRFAWELGKLKEKLDPRETFYEEGSFQNDAVQQSFIRAASNFDVKPYPGKLTLYRPVVDTSYEVAPGRYLNSDRELVRPDQGWTGHVQELEICEVPGDHDHMVLEPEVRVLAGLMMQKLASED